MHFVLIKRLDLGGAIGLDTQGRSYAAKVAHSRSRRRRVLQYQQEKLQRQIKAIQPVKTFQQVEENAGQPSLHNILSSARRDPFSTSTFVAPINTYEAGQFDYCKTFTSSRCMNRFEVDKDRLSRLICTQLSM